MASLSSQSDVHGHLLGNFSACACSYLRRPAFSIREHMAVFTGTADHIVAFTVVIAVATAAMPVASVNQRTSIMYITLQLPDMVDFFPLKIDIRAVLLPILRQRIVPVFNHGRSVWYSGWYCSMLPQRWQVYLS